MWSELEALTHDVAGVPDHHRDVNVGKLCRLTYCLGLSDDGVPVEELPHYLDSLTERASCLRADGIGS